jgi:hypothetical protein
MLIKGQGCICDLSSTSLRERHGSEGSWIDGNGRPLVHYREQGRAEEVLQELWEQAKTGAGFYEIPQA